MTTLITLLVMGYIAFSAWFIVYLVKRFAQNNFAREFWIVIGVSCFMMTIPFPIMVDLGILN